MTSRFCFAELKKFYVSALFKEKARGNDKKHGKKDLDRNVTKLDFAEKNMNIE